MNSLLLQFQLTFVSPIWIFPNSTSFYLYDALGGSYYYYYYLTDGKTEAWSVPILGWRQTSFQNSPDILELSEQCPGKESAGAAAGSEGGWLWAYPWPQWVPSLSHLGVATLTIFGGPCPPDYQYLSRLPAGTVTFLTLMMIYIIVFIWFLFYFIICSALSIPLNFDLFHTLSQVPSTEPSKW